MGHSPRITTSHRITSLEGHPTDSTLRRLSLVWAESVATHHPMLRIFFQGVKQHTLTAYIISTCKESWMITQTAEGMLQGLTSKEIKQIHYSWTSMQSTPDRQDQACLKVDRPHFFKVD